MERRGVYGGYYFYGAFYRAQRDVARTAPDLASDQTSTLQDSLQVFVGLNQSPGNRVAKGDNLIGGFTLNPFADDDPMSGAGYGQLVPYGLSVLNNSAVTLNDVLALDRIPDGMTFHSSWFGSMASSGTIFYATTTNFPDARTPPPVTNITSSFLGPDWTVYDPLNPPAPMTISNVTWLGWRIPRLDSVHFPPPSNAVVGEIAFFDATVDRRTDECSSILFTNIGLFRIYGLTPMSGVPQPVNGGFVESSDIEFTAAEPRVGVFNVESTQATLDPILLEVPGVSTYRLAVENMNLLNSDTFSNVTVDIAPGYRGGDLATEEGGSILIWDSLEMMSLPAYWTWAPSLCC